VRPIKLKMLKHNPVQFAVVREDPEVECALFREFDVGQALLISSGGCTALTLASRFPDASLYLVEPNLAQISLIKNKSRLINTASGRKKIELLIESGNFEALFRGLREFIFEFIVSAREMEFLLVKGTRSQWKRIFRHTFWPVAFELYFADELLLAIFGRSAIQHAPRDSYPRHFRRVLERGLLRSDRATNYFLHHIFLGHYLTQAKPFYLQRPPTETHFAYFHGLAQTVPDFARFDFVGLSNIFDWSSTREIKNLTVRLQNEMKIGACVLYRQLNNEKNFEGFFNAGFRWYNQLAKRLHKKDRSLFYSSLHIGQKIR